MEKEEKNPVEPFFARFLEKQIGHPEQITGGSHPHGGLYDGDDDDRKPKGSKKSKKQDEPIYVTMKYPSDADEEAIPVYD